MVNGIIVLKVNYVLMLSRVCLIISLLFQADCWEISIFRGTELVRVIFFDFVFY